MPAVLFRGATSRKSGVDKHRLHIATGILVLFLAFALRLLFFTTSITHLPASSDEVLSILQAKRIAAGHTPLLVKANTYQFPVESYLSTPFTRLLPRNAFGARFIPLLLGFATTGFLAFIMLQLVPFKRSWPALLLLLFPSAYLLMLQTAYMIPQHNSLLLLCTLAVAAAVLHRKKREYPACYAAAAGLLAGLAFSNHLVALPVLVMVVLFIMLDEHPHYLRKSTPAVLAGLILGTAPYWLALRFLPGAYGAVTGMDTIPKAISKLWPYTITYTLPRALGFNPCHFPDSRETLEVMPGLESVWGILFVMGLLAGVVYEAFRITRYTIRNRWPTLTTGGLFTGICAITLLLFVLNKRSTVESFRYLLPLVVFYPFLLLPSPDQPSSRPLSLVRTCGILVVAGINILMTIRLAESWQTPGFAVKQANIADIQPAIARLRELGITHACASYWASYRMTYETDGAITCSQPINERFPGWYVPYKAEVDASTNVAYVLTEGIRFLKPHIFDRHLATMGVTSQREIHGDFVVYHDFRQTESVAARTLIPPDHLVLSASHNPAAATQANDGDPETRWMTDGSFQESGMWFQAAWDQPRTVSAIRITYHRYYHDHPPLMDVRLRTETGWENVTNGIPGTIDKFEFLNGHPVYGGIARQTIAIPPRTARSIQLVINQPNPRSCWSICELECFEQSASLPVTPTGPDRQ